MKKIVLLSLAAMAISGTAIGYNLTVTDHSHDTKATGGTTEIINSHSGGTDAYGCHRNLKTGGYHCH